MLQISTWFQAVFSMVPFHSSYSGDTSTAGSCHVALLVLRVARSPPYCKKWYVKSFVTCCMKKTFNNFVSRVSTQCVFKKKTLTILTLCIMFIGNNFFFSNSFLDTERSFLYTCPGSPSKHRRMSGN